MHAIFCRRVAVGCSSPQLTKLVTKQASQSRHSLSHLLPFDLSSRFVPPYVVSRSARVHGFFAGKLGNTNLKLKFGNVMESRAGFFSSELPSHGFESGGFTGFQKRGWKSWINGANGVVFGLVIANAAVFTMWRVLGKDNMWMVKNFMLSRYSFMTGRIHTLITSGFSHVGATHIILNMMGLCYFGARIARSFGPRYLLKLYFAGALGGSVFFLSSHALSVISLKGQRVVPKDQLKVPIGKLGANGPVYAITLLDMLLYPKVTTYFGLMLRVPVFAGIYSLGLNIIKMLEGKNNNTLTSLDQLGGVVVAVIAWARIRKGRFCY
ncbi:Rhomboid-like protein 16 [Arabidopsis thaliana]|uniref:Rhomboid-like protein 16, chloroplastic n=4 Tax=Arabidopsis TaxID=3701 RepID=RBL16_ARATH|nr:Rhomboid-related intramembrane serine protease family protein [Arabidopsis thaliana]Q84WG3.1 RecName: Full=Rhomboid-like protein 16, chloroplastic; Short=AtRBL16; Flags: Precursor [Arabidopsis thaliana]KAG7651648.1 Peptidase S54 rhomboid domain [Arabidopsis thaliana x Arabidopsis arenosa]KAG7659514.1 Peptidase S54 rhomboid domain [Arabidopsis suecica]AAO41899.1 unknown protein [Arabidopsis thaliana]AEE35554.1 Rhomboid-related intramembrane serine protease family protein [Arabidopsis thalian|eukprot:NP_177553.3 Rhomboid-related intramembrane serine protease family protein [Arabidopsis thaliana]